MSLTGGTYQGVVTLTPGGSGASPLPIPVTLTVTGAGAPSITTGGIVNALGYQTTLAPDTVFVIFGGNLGPAAPGGVPRPIRPDRGGKLQRQRRRHFITPLYAGASSGYPGLWQINFTLPATIAADCFALLFT